MDDELRRRARAARAEVEAQVDVEAELAARPTSSNVATVTPLPPRRRLVAVAGSIAAVAVAIVGGVVLLRGNDSIETSEPTVDASTSIPSVIPTTLPGPTTTVAPTTSVSAATTTTSPMATTVAAVSYLDPPAATTLTPLGAVPVPEPTAGAYQVAIGDLGVAVATWPYDSTGGRVDVIGFDGSTRTVDNLPTSGAIAYGPGDVVYSTVQGETIEDFAVVSMPLSGDRVGEIVASEPANINQYLEYPPASFGHRSDGVTNRRADVGDVGDVGEVAIGYVDVDGNPTTLDVEPTTYDIDRDLLTEIPRSGFRSGVVTSSDGDTWNLSVDKHPDAAETYVGPSPVAPTTDGNGVLWTHVGPDIAPEQDFGVGSRWVVAHLHPGGSATWWSLPDGWTIAASDIWGTAAVRQTGDQVEVALVDFATDDPPTDTTTTTTTSTPGTVPTTTVSPAAVAWQTLPWEAARIERNCSDDQDAGCTQILVDRDGTIVSYDPTTRTLTRHTTPAISTTVIDDLGTVYLELLGPDQVVYLNVDAAEPGDGAADLVAMSLASDDAGRVLGRWAGVTDRVGDQDLVATRDGLVVVGCCDHEVLRPDPDAEVVLPWIARDGTAASISGPAMRTEVDLPTLTVHRDDAVPVGTRTWTVDPPADWQPRGMPTVIPTFDGGFIAITFDGVDQTVIRGWVDGAIDMVTIDTYEALSLDPNGRVLIADGDRFARFDPFEDRNTYWDGELDVDVGGTGAITVSRRASHIDEPWVTDPVAFASAVVGPLPTNEQRTITTEQIDDSVVRATVTTTNFFDDSVFGSRYELDFSVGDDGHLTLTGGTWGQVCQPDRGHQDFTPELCR